jgi:hypothetical protein
MSKFALSLLRDFLWERPKVSFTDQNSAVLKTLIYVFKQYKAHFVICLKFLHFLDTILILYNIRTIISVVESINAVKYLLLCVTLNYKYAQKYQQMCEPNLIKCHDFSVMQHASVLLLIQ